MIRNRRKQATQAKQKKPSTPVQELTFLEHFYELRKRLFWVILSLVVASAVGFQYKDQLIAAVVAPLHGEKLVYLTPGGGFSFIFTVSIYFGLLVSIPVIIYHIYRFLQPLIAKPSRSFTVLLISISVLLAAAGASFGYFVTIPAAINFLSTFAGDAVTPNLTADSYLSFVVSYILGLAFLFQIPLLLFTFDHIRPIPPGIITKTQNYVIIAATVIAAIITPTPDAFNMAVVAVPMILVYEVGALAVFTRHHFGRGRKVAPAKTVPLFAPVPVPVTDEPDVPVAEPLSTIQPIQTSEVQRAVRRSIDGLTLHPRQAPLITRVPSRTEPAARTIAPRAASSHQGRSIDGFVPSKRYEALA